MTFGMRRGLCVTTPIGDGVVAAVGFDMLTIDVVLDERRGFPPTVFNREDVRASTGSCARCHSVVGRLEDVDRFLCAACARA